MEWFVVNKVVNFIVFPHCSSFQQIYLSSFSWVLQDILSLKKIESVSTTNKLLPRLTWVKTKLYYPDADDEIDFDDDSETDVGFIAVHDELEDAGGDRILVTNSLEALDFDSNRKLTIRKEFPETFVWADDLLG